MNEHDAIKRIHDKKRKTNSIDRTKVRVWKVRDDFTAGVPDCMYLSRVTRSQPLYVEYKHIKKLPARDSTMIVPKWHSGEQKEWLNEMHSAGCSALVIITFGEGREAGAIILYDKEWDDGISTKEARRRAVTLNTCATIIERIACDDGEVTDFIKKFEGNLGAGS